MRARLGEFNAKDVGGVAPPVTVIVTEFEAGLPAEPLQVILNVVLAVSAPTAWLPDVGLTPVHWVLLGLLDALQVVVLVLFQRMVTGVPEATLVPGSALILTDG